MHSRLNEVQSAILSPMEMMKRFLGTGATVPSPALEQSDSSPQVAALQKRVEELEAQLGKKASRKRAGKRKVHPKVS